MNAIYEIVNIINNKKYIGSTKNVESRIKNHFYLLENNKHKNKHLQYSYNKYGKENFRFRVLKEFKNISREELFDMEQIYIDKYNFDDLFNYSKIVSKNVAKSANQIHLLLNLRGDIVNEFDSIEELSNFLNFKSVIPINLINKPSTVRLEYRVVTKEFYEKELNLILSWRKYKSLNNKFNDYYEYDKELGKWIVFNDSEIIMITDCEKKAIKISKYVCKLSNKNLI